MPSKLFAETGETFILGAFAGYTSGKIKRLIEEHGGSVTDDYTVTDLERVIVSPIIWGQQGTAGASLILKKIILANKENFEATEDHQYRVWILPLEYLTSSIELEEQLDPEENDLELTVAHVRQRRAEELAEERKANGGKSKYAPGERKKIENAKKAAALEKQLELEKKQYEDAQARAVEREKEWAERAKKMEEARAARAAQNPYQHSIMQARAAAIAASASSVPKPSTLDLTANSISPPPATTTAAITSPTATASKGGRVPGEPAQKKAEKTDWNAVGSGSGLGGSESGGGSGGVVGEESKEVQSANRNRFLDKLEGKKSRTVETLTLDSDSDGEAVIVERAPKKPKT